jgi:Xaa-Pro aminopeptidase
MTIAERLAALRAEFAPRRLDGFLVPRADEHLGEYVPDNAQRLAWISGFTGSAGLALILADRAVLFTDGRYILQARAQADAALFDIRHIIEEPPHAWLKQNAPGLRIGCDPLTLSEQAVTHYAEAGFPLAFQESNPLDAVWRDRPPPPAAPVVPHDVRFAGRTAEEKRTELAAALAAARQDAAVLSDPASACWLLNIRGGDVPHTPLVLAHTILHADGTVDLFLDPARADAALRSHLGNAVRPRPRGELGAALDALAGRTVRVDRAGTPAWFAQRLRAAGVTVVDGPDPCALPRATKNATEQQGTRDAHARDAVAVCRFLHWLAGSAIGTTEVAAAARLDALRAEHADYRGESFPAIAGSGPNGAVIHYRATPGTDRMIGADEMFLIDSGGQYPDGTTDVTRAVWTGSSAPPDELRDRYTRVLQGHIALATLRFPQGVAGPHLDALARRALWDAGLDYDHGTGHGVGAYLGVHEGPAAFSRAAKPVPLAPGMILSNEPGFYAPGAYGIRLENLLLVVPSGLEGTARPFLAFETLTLAPFDRTLIAAGQLTAQERAWLDAYHARVAAEVTPRLPEDVRGWLEKVCRPL